MRLNPESTGTVLTNLRAAPTWVAAWVFLVAAGAPVTAFAQEPTTTAAAPDVLTAYDVARLSMVTDAVISPDGQSVAYVLAVPRKVFDDDNGAAWRELHVVDGAAVSRPFITGEVSIGSIDWTPDGKGISFLTKRGDDKENALYVIPIDGGEARKVLSHEAGIDSYSWSPDGSRVAFLAKEKEDKDKKELEDKGFNQQIYEEELHPVRVWIGTPNDEDAKPKMLEIAGSASELHWSPVGSRLAVALAPTPLIDDHYMKRKVHVVDADTGDVITQLENPGKLGEIAWSPDGEHLAMISAEDIHDPAEGRLLVAAYAGGELTDVLPNYQGHVADIAWQDKDTIMFVGGEGVWTSFGEVRRDGAGRVTHVPGEGGAIIGSFTLSQDGRSAAMVADSPTHLSEVFLSTHDAKAPRRLTDSNPWLAEKRLAKQEVVRYKARDGLELEGLLVRPLDEEPGTRYPLILDVHGGPESHYSNGWLTRYASAGQVGAAQGFAVFYPNYRGSTGRGVEFSKTSQADAAGKEFDDLVDAVDHLVATGLVDKSKVGITGGSYGGYASAWGATYYTERFAASVMFVGISDKISKTGTTDIANEEFLVHARKKPWEHWDEFRARSPLYYAAQCKTPLLIMHGKDDPRVHPSQSMELYRYVKMATDTPVRLVFYPGEGHGNRKAAARLDYNLRLMQWMRHYLQGEGGPPPPFEIEYDRPKKDEEDDAASQPASDEVEEN